MSLTDVLLENMSLQCNTQYKPMSCFPLERNHKGNNVK